MAQPSLTGSPVLALQMTPVWIGSPNYMSRNGWRPEAIVIHVTEGSIGSVDSHFRSPKSKVSAHYCVTKAGLVHQYVREEHAAQSQGVVDDPTWERLRPGVNPNLYCLSIEHEAGATEEWPELMYERSARLIAEMAVRWQIPLFGPFLPPHRAIRASKTCPGRGDVAKLIRLARWRMGGCLEMPDDPGAWDL